MSRSTDPNANRTACGTWADVAKGSTVDTEILFVQRIDAEALLRLSETPAVKATYERYTHAAVEAGVFGSPSYVLEGEIFWGQDRLDFLEDALQRVSA